MTQLHDGDRDLAAAVMPISALDEGAAADVPPNSWLDVYLRGLPFAATDDRGTKTLLPSSFLVQPYHSTQPPTKAFLMALDLGNNALKAGMIGVRHGFKAIYVPTTYQPAQRILHGASKSTWRIVGDPSQEEFWMGADVDDAGDSLPIGKTSLRLSDKRYQRFVKASIVRCLQEAGYQPGAYTLILGVGIRNEEIAEADGRQQLDVATAAALKALKAEPFTVHYQQGGISQQWTITIATIHAAAQTLGTFFAWHYTLSSAPAQREIKKLAILDFGGGDTHLLQVEWRGERLTVTGERLGDGTVEIAHGLIDRVKREFNGRQLSLAEAQNALVLGTILYGGRDQSIAHIVADLKRSRVENLLGRVMPVLQNTATYLISTGRGSILIRREIEERMVVVKRAPENYLIVPAGAAGIANCLGLWAFAYLRVLSTLSDAQARSA